MTSSHSSPHNSIPVVSEAKMEISTLNDEFSRRNNRVERASRDRGNFEASFSPFGMYKFRISCAHKFYANSILLFFSSKLHCDLLPCSSLCARCVALCDVRAFRQFTQFTFPTVLCVFLFSVIFCAGWCSNRRLNLCFIVVVARELIHSVATMEKKELIQQKKTAKAKEKSGIELTKSN